MFKQCFKCCETKNIDNFQFRKDNNAYRNECKQCCQQRINKYRRENMEFKKRYNDYRKQRRIQDTQYAMTDRLRARIRKLLKSTNCAKYSSTLNILGCSMEEFKTHITSQFYGDMSWEKKNFVLDHKIPCSWFNFSIPKHQLLCFNYKNIQPLTHEDNTHKSDKAWTQYNLSKNPYI